MQGHGQAAGFRLRERHPPSAQLDYALHDGQPDAGTRHGLPRGPEKPLAKAGQHGGLDARTIVADCQPRALDIDADMTIRVAIAARIIDQVANGKGQPVAPPPDRLG